MLIWTDAFLQVKGLLLDSEVEGAKKEFYLKGAHVLVGAALMLRSCVVVQHVLMTFRAPRVAACPLEHDPACCSAVERASACAPFLSWLAPATATPSLRARLTLLSTATSCTHRIAPQARRS